ncbi:hypothetical protein VIGAN_09233900 [Vigna angularis var. angularis]|uniref:Uncharacterized protein n=1 Tax=Vigna angularis var. angularis TaxID=157739 RepID=A0A0S3T157_PHAAN|nr:hypothetical protein VIGAN_09233900 [Vigna angularis var. angularis]
MVVAGKVSENLELREEDGGKVRAVLPAELRALEGQVGKGEGLCEGPVRDGWVQNLGKGLLLDGLFDLVGQAHGGPSRQ